MSVTIFLLMAIRATAGRTQGVMGLRVNGGPGFEIHLCRP